MLDLLKPLNENYMPQNITLLNEELSTGELRDFQMKTKWRHKNIHYYFKCKLMKLENSSLELYNTSNAKELSIFTMPIKMQKILFCIFQYFRANALNEWKTNENTNLRNDK